MVLHIIRGILLAMLCCEVAAKPVQPCCQQQMPINIHDAKTPQHNNRPSLTYYIRYSGGLRTFERALERAGLLREAGISESLINRVRENLDMDKRDLENITIFAPHNRAFRDMPSSIRNQLFNNPAYLRDVLLYHMVGGRYTERDFDSGVMMTLFNERITLEYQPNGDIVIDGHARIITTDVMARDGVIHTIDRILLP